MATEPWERQEGESGQAYEAFCAYRDMGANRTLRAVAAGLGKSVALISRWGTDHRWVSRTEAWDSMPARAVADAYAEMARDIAEQHRALSDKLMRKLSRNLDLLPDGQDPTMRWSAAHTSARMGHQFSTDLSRPKDAAKDEINKQIASLIERLVQED